MTKQMTREETDMQKLAVSFQDALQTRNYQRIQGALQDIRVNLEPLGYWLPYKDLTDLLIERCNPKDLAVMSDQELAYLGELSQKFEDKDSDVGLGTLVRFYERLETIKAERQINRLSELQRGKLPVKVLASILKPSDYEARLREYRSRKNEKGQERKGLWDSWQSMSTLSQDKSGLENMVCSGLTDKDVFKYADAFMTVNLYSNLFQIGFDQPMIDHVLDVLRLYFRVLHKSGVPAEKMPAILEEQIMKRLDAAGKSKGYDGWRGTKEFMYMTASSKFADEKFMGVKWRKYEPERQCIDWVVEFAEKGEDEKARYVGGIARDCGKNFSTITAELVRAAVDKFTEEYVRRNRIDTKSGKFLLAAQNYFGTDYKLALSQPFVHKAIIEAAKKGHKFAKMLIEKLDNRLDLDDMFITSALIDIVAKGNETPYVDLPAREHKEHLMHRMQKHIERTNVDYLVSAPDVFKRAMAEGNYLEPMNVCNTSLEDIRKLARHGRTAVRTRREKRDSDYAYVARDMSFVFDRDRKNPRIVIGNPQSFNNFCHLLGYTGGSVSIFRPQKENVQRHIVVEFEDQELKRRAIAGIVKSWYGTIRPVQKNKFYLVLTAEDDYSKHERVCLEMVSKRNQPRTELS